MDQFINLVTEMSPYLLLGFLLAGLMHAFIPGTLYSKYLAKPNMRSVVLAASSAFCFRYARAECFVFDCVLAAAYRRWTLRKTFEKITWI